MLIQHKISRLSCGFYKPWQTRPVFLQSFDVMSLNQIIFWDYKWGMVNCWDVSWRPFFSSIPTSWNKSPIHNLLCVLKSGYGVSSAISNVRWKTMFCWQRLCYNWFSSQMPKTTDFHLLMQLVGLMQLSLTAFSVSSQKLYPTTQASFFQKLLNIYST